MTTKQRNIGFIWVSAMVAVAAVLVSAPSASATQTNQYAPFSNCPTSAPALNDPASELAICASGLSHGVTLKIGALTIPIAQQELQFAATGFGMEEPECPQEGFCFGRVPDSTTIVSSTSEVRLPTHKGSGLAHHGHDRGLEVSVTLESAGDILAVSPAFLFQQPIPLYRLPVKLHLQAPWLSRQCYLGSDAEPIFLNPLVVAPPESLGVTADPNGFHTEILTLTGLTLLDNTFAVPAAHGCGHGGGYRWRPPSGQDRILNGLLGLPSPSGSNEVALPGTDIAFAVAGYDGTPPDGGAELQAAFEAAK